jgi:hypothetical protein
MSSENRASIAACKLISSRFPLKKIISYCRGEVNILVYFAEPLGDFEVAGR